MAILCVLSYCLVSECISEVSLLNALALECPCMSPRVRQLYDELWLNREFEREPDRLEWLGCITQTSLASSENIDSDQSDSLEGLDSALELEELLTMSESSAEDSPNAGLPASSSTMTFGEADARGEELNDISTSDPVPARRLSRISRCRCGCIGATTASSCENPLVQAMNNFVYCEYSSFGLCPSCGYISEIRRSSFDTDLPIKVATSDGIFDWSASIACCEMVKPPSKVVE